MILTGDDSIENKGIKPNNYGGNKKGGSTFEGEIGTRKRWGMVPQQTLRWFEAASEARDKGRGSRALTSLEVSRLARIEFLKTGSLGNGFD